MLTSHDQEAAASAGKAALPDKQIGATTNTNGAVFYTVPAGRVFRGWLSNNASNQGSGAYALNVVDGVEILHRGAFTSETQNYRTSSSSPTLTLLAGTSVKNYGSDTSYIFGVESDA